MSSKRRLKNPWFPESKRLKSDTSNQQNNFVLESSQYYSKIVSKWNKKQKFLNFSTDVISVISQYAEGHYGVCIRGDECSNKNASFNYCESLLLILFFFSL